MFLRPLEGMADHTALGLLFFHFYMVNVSKFVNLKDPNGVSRKEEIVWNLNI